jgi:hypothetical protein
MELCQFSFLFNANHTESPYEGKVEWRIMEDTSTVQYVVCPDGERMTRADLPPPTIRRWVPRRKARVVAAVEGGLISREEAYSRYAISHEEFEDWKSGLSSHGLRGLCVTKINQRHETSE